VFITSFMRSFSTMFVRPSVQRRNTSPFFTKKLSDMSASIIPSLEVCPETCKACFLLALFDASSDLKCQSYKSFRFRVVFGELNNFTVCHMIYTAVSQVERLCPVTAYQKSGKGCSHSCTVLNTHIIYQIIGIFNIRINMTAQLLILPLLLFLMRLWAFFNSLMAVREASSPRISPPRPSLTANRKKESASFISKRIVFSVMDGEKNMPLR